MKILVAMDSFKGSCSAIDAAIAVENGIKAFIPTAEVVLIPVSDGGEGMVSAILHATGGRLVTKEVTGPMGAPVAASFAVLDDGTAIIEMAAASGLTLIEKEDRNPLKATTYGTGELILEAVSLGCKKIVLGLGGSATNDGGVGAAMALGINFRDANGSPVGFGGAELIKICDIDTSGIKKELLGVDIKIACDVNNPLYGENGAAFVFAAQKGADGEMIKQLDCGLAHYATIIKDQFHIDFSIIPGVGAAGGLAVPLIAFLGAKIEPGIALILDTIGFDKQVKNADLVITGEGQLDFQTVFGKVPVGVAEHAKKYDKPVIAIVGSIGKNYRDVYHFGIDSVFNIQSSPMTLEASMQNSEALLTDCAERVMRVFVLDR